MADKLISNLGTAAFALTDVLEHEPLAGPPSTKGDINALITLLNTVYGTGPFLPLAGGTMTGDILFNADNTIDIGASGATRPRRGFFGTEVVSPLFTGALTGAASANVLKAGDTMTGLLTLAAVGVSFGSSVLLLDAANIIAQRNGVNIQTFRNYRTFTDASNYERLSLAGPVIAFEIAGSGSARTLYLYNRSSEAIIFGTSNADRWTVATAGHFQTSTNNTLDIGASGATSPRSIYFGTSLFRGATKVVGAQGAAIADAGAGAVAQVAVGATECTDKINLILGALRTHGLIAT